MKNKVLIVAVIICHFFLSEVKAQQDAQFTQYMYNTMAVNSAYAGTRGTFSASILNRAQWVGIEGAPKTQTIAFHAPYGQSEKVGLGFSAVNDRIGPTQETSFDAVFSYTVKVLRGDMSFGLNAGGQLLDVNFSKLSPYNAGDPLLQNDIENKFSPNVGVGLYYRKGSKWYVGLSVPRLLETKHFDTESLSVAKERMNLYLIGGYVLTINDVLKFKPAVLFKTVSGAPLQADVSANFLIKDKLTLGLAYRWSAASSALLGYQFKEGLMFGFAYDKEVTDLGLVSFERGTYEVFLRFELKKASKILSPRFF